MSANSVLWKLAFRSLLRQRRRNFISLTMIALGFASLILVAAHRYRGDHHMQTTAAYLNRKGQISVYKKDGHLRHLSDQRKYSLSKLEQTDIASIANQVGGVEMVGNYLVIPGLLSNGCSSVPVIITGIDMAVETSVSNHPRVLYWTPDLYDIRKGVTLNQETSNKLTPIMTTPMVADQLGKGIELNATSVATNVPLVPDCMNKEHVAQLGKDPQMQLLLRDALGDVTVIDVSQIGRYRTGTLFLDDVSVAVPLLPLQEGLDSEIATYVGIYLKDIDTREATLSALNLVFTQQNLPYQALSSTGKELNMLYDGIMKWFWAVEIFVYLLLGFIILITIFNFLTMSILERRSEIGTLRAIGFKPWLVARIFQIESFLLSFIGVVFGGALAHVTMLIINSLEIPYRPPGVPGVIHFILAADFALYIERAISLLILTTLCSFAVTWWQSYRGSINKLLTST